jgi:hypothetical protein
MQASLETSLFHYMQMSFVGRKNIVPSTKILLAGGDLLNLSTLTHQGVSDLSLYYLALILFLLSLSISSNTF